MRINITNAALKDYNFWKLNDAKKFNRINVLIKSIKEDPTKGIGKPEPLKFNLQGHWSRRIDKKNRLVYLPGDNEVTIISCRYHY